MEWLRKQIEEKTKICEIYYHEEESEIEKGKLLGCLCAYKRVLSLIDQVNCSNCNIDCDMHKKYGGVTSCSKYDEM